jgi:hypothetical protein
VLLARSGGTAASKGPFPRAFKKVIFVGHSMGALIGNPHHGTFLICSFAVFSKENWGSWWTYWPFRSYEVSTEALVIVLEPGYFRL